MLTFIGRRLFYLIPVLLAVSLLTFLIASLLPGDLAYVILGDQATPERSRHCAMTWASTGRSGGST